RCSRRKRRGVGAKIVFAEPCFCTGNYFRKSIGYARSVRFRFSKSEIVFGELLPSVYFLYGCCISFVCGNSRGIPVVSGNEKRARKTAEKHSLLFFTFDFRLPASDREKQHSYTKHSRKRKRS